MIIRGNRSQQTFKGKGVLENNRPEIRGHGLRVVLYEPEIPQNTGNIARTCAATDTPLDLIGPLGFSLKDKYLKRAGLDYWPHVNLNLYNNFEDFLKSVIPKRCLVYSKKGKTRYDLFDYGPGDCLIFGSETGGLPVDFFGRFESLYLPMPSGNVRSLNLSTAVGIALYHALQRLGWSQA